MTRKVSHAYYVKYCMHPWEDEKGIQVAAHNKDEAYDIAVNEAIPNANEGHYAYSAWVSSVTYQNGNYHRFNGCEW